MPGDIPAEASSSNASSSVPTPAPVHTDPPSAPVTAPTSAPTPAPAHPAFTPAPFSSSSSSSSTSRKHIKTLPTASNEIINLISQANSIQFINDIVIPTLQDVSEGKSFENTSAKLKEKERILMGEQTLTCAEDNLYGINDNDVGRMTAGLTYIVSARLNVFKHTPSLYKDELLNFAIRLCSLGDAQQFYLIPKRVAHLAWGILRISQYLKKVSLAIPAIQTLIQKSCISGHFSGIYAAYLEACLLDKNFQAGILVLDQVFLHVRSVGATYLDVLTYYHHAGLISAALKDFSKAKQYFITAVSLPTTTTSAIQLACAKRAVLCELLDTGKRISFPRYTSSTVTRVIDKSASTYMDLAKEYEASRWSAVREIVGKYDFAQDCNAGLIEQVLKSITKRRILQLREIYSRMTINDLVSRVGQSSKETVETITAILGEMITSGSINASITPGSTPANSIVTFNEDKLAYNNSNNSSTNHLAQVNYLAGQLENELTEMSRRLGISKEYLKKQANILEMGSGGKSGGKHGARVDDFDQLMAAEDIVGGGGIRGVGGNLGDMGF